MLTARARPIDPPEAGWRTGQPLRMTACAGAAFDAALAGFDDVIPEQAACFAAHRWAGKRIEHRLLLAGDDIVAAATVVTVGLFGTGLAAVKWGPLWRRAGRAADPAIYAAAVAALAREYAAQRGLAFSVMAPADPVWGGAMAAGLAEAGFKAREPEPHADRYFVDLAPAEAQLRAGLASKWRYNLVKSEAAGFTVHVLDGAAGVRAFMPLYAAMLERKRFHDDSAVGSLPALFQAEATVLHPVTFTVELAGAPVAGAVVARAGDVARYLYGASADDGLDRKPGYVLHWVIMRWLKAQSRCRWYALGGTDGFAGLAQFKKGMVGRGGVICSEPPACELALTRRAALAGPLLYRLRSLRAQAVARIADARLRR